MPIFNKLTPYNNIITGLIYIFIYNANAEKELYTMKIIFDKSDLLNAINIVLKAVPSKTTMSILECILIDATTDDIKFTANDMELGIETKVKGEVLEKGSIAIDAKIFSEIIRKLPDSEVIIETDSLMRMDISCEKAHFNIAGKTGEDFSSLPDVEKNKFIFLSQFTLREIIRQTIFSIAPTDSSNKIMTGILIEIFDGKMKVVSLDGHRVSLRNIDLKDAFDNIKVIVPGKTLNEISKILSGNAEDEVRIFFTDNHIVFEFENTVVVSRLIEGNYFNVEQMLSNDYETKVIINKKDFVDCIDRATLLVKESDRKPIVFAIQDGEMELKINSTIGSMNENIIINKEGKDLMIGFNPKFLLEALKVIDDEEINIYFLNSKAPMYMKDENESYNYLILPVAM